MDLYKVLYQLIKENDCVIIPGFGGFIANYFDAKTDLRNQEFYPPSRRIFFNENLKNNDGLLINYIANNYNLSWDSAEKQVSDFVLGIKEKLERKEVVKFYEIGEFSNKSGTLVFTPNDVLNLLEDSFGLTSFNFPMVRSERAKVEIHPKPVLSTTKSAKLNKPKKSRKALWITATSAAVVTGLLFMSVYFGLLDLNVEENINYTNVIPVEVIKLKNPEPELKAGELPFEEGCEKVETIFEEIADVSENINIEVEEKKQKVVNYNESITAHAIAGSFSNYQNAEKLKNDLQALGYFPEILPIKNGMYRVAAKSYSDRKIAVNELETLRSSLNNESLWVLFI